MKIGLLLLTITNPYFPENIKEYLNKDINLYVHAKYPNELDNFFKKYLIKNLIETKWGDMSLVNATINLLEEAYEECDYFYLISGDSYIINKPTSFDLSCFDYMKEYNNKYGKFYKSSQWWGLNKKDAKIIIDTREKYTKLFNNFKLDGAYDENYFLTVLNREQVNYEYIIKNVMFVKWLANIISKHPFIFNKITQNDMYLFKNSLFIRKCSTLFKYKETKIKRDVYIFYIGSETNQEDIIKLDLMSIDYIIIMSLEIEKINKIILKNAFYIIPIIWKFYYNSIKSISRDINISDWKNMLFVPEIFDYKILKDIDITNWIEKNNIQTKVLSSIKFNNNDAFLFINY